MWHSLLSPGLARVILLVYLAAIYGTLGYARQISNALRDAGRLRMTVLLVFAVVGVIAALALLRERRFRNWKVGATLGACAGVYAAVTLPMRLPEEKLHFIQYGIAALLAYAAAPRSWPTRARFIGAALFVAAAGWVDEGIQALMPTRFYDLRDVAFNTAAGVIALMALAALRWSSAVPASAETKPQT